MISIPTEVANTAPDPVLNRAFITANDAAAHLHESLKDRRNSEYAGFILKNQDGYFFPSTEITDGGFAKDPNLPLAVLLKPDGKFVVPDGYTVAARFISHVDVMKGTEENLVERIQRKYFFTIPDLFAVMTHRRKFSSCYFSGSDGCLISYVSRNSEFEQELSSQLSKAIDGTSKTFERLYARGAIPSSILILLAVAAGEVTAVIPGDLWRRRGRVNASWRKEILQQNPPIELMPVCGPIFKDAKGAAHYAHTQMAEFRKKPPVKQYSGVILKHKTKDVFVATEPVDSDYANFSRETLFPKDHNGKPQIPADFRIYGIYHSMNPVPDNRLPSVEVELYKNFFSPSDMRIGLDRIAVAPNQRLFLSTLDGAVLRFASTEISKVTELLAKLACQADGRHDIEQQIIDGVMSPQQFVDLVAAVGTLSVLYSSKTWPSIGQVHAPVATVIVEA
ncbi:DUF4329 domain-containing protein [Pseudomonas mandelii]|uniref:DUF4329 domain-containing protein n=1 Tax=Pseudomonas mandelii TaxID=75612 RepID=UPI00209FB108|nr:DUF4329 domain-containing protein [Pseudomonas mandelii]MCO8314463.1 DUF4329 domain-containing protein [Pseudomonas mandelii]